MNATATIGRLADMSPRVKARLAGGFLLITMLAGVFAQGFIGERLIVSGDAAATASNILAHEQLYRLGFAIYLIEMACQITMTVLFYDLLKPVSRSVSLLAAAFGLVGCTIKTLSRLFFLPRRSPWCSSDSMHSRRATSSSGPPSCLGCWVCSGLLGVWAG